MFSQTERRAHVGTRYGRLTFARVRSLSTPGRNAAGPTLYLRIAPGGTKRRVQRLTIDGRRHDIGLGGWPLVTLAEAREQAFDNRRLVRQGGNPLGDKRRATAPTCAEASRRALEVNRGRWRNRKTADNWIATMAKYVVNGPRKLKESERESVQVCFLKKQKTKPGETSICGRWVPSRTSVLVMPGRGTLARRNGLTGAGRCGRRRRSERAFRRATTRVPRKARLAHAATVGMSGVGRCARRACRRRSRARGPRLDGR